MLLAGTNFIATSSLVNYRPGTGYTCVPVVFLFFFRRSLPRSISSARSIPHRSGRRLPPAAAGAQLPLRPLPGWPGAPKRAVGSAPHAATAELLRAQRRSSARTRPVRSSHTSGGQAPWGGRHLQWRRRFSNRVSHDANPNQLSWNRINNPIEPGPASICFFLPIHRSVLSTSLLASSESYLIWQLRSQSII
jgi:hypothetical protein